MYLLCLTDNGFKYGLITHLLAGKKRPENIHWLADRMTPVVEGRGGLTKLTSPANTLTTSVHITAAQRQLPSLAVSGQLSLTDHYSRANTQKQQFTYHILKLNKKVFR